MAHVFRFHEGNASLEGWDFSQQYDNKAIAAIKDPAGASAALPITSIPSPFANFELVRSAFSIVAKNPEVGLGGTTIYHKLVSYALDVLEIFFNYRMLRNHYEIIKWERSDLKLLTENPVFAQLGKTLELYLEQDAEGFNFDSMSSIFILNYKDGPEARNIVGATSPVSVCVASPDDLGYVTTYLTNHTAFNPDPESFKALYERGDDFILYLWTLSKQSLFVRTFPEVNDYVQACFSKVTDVALKERMRGVTAEDYGACYEQLRVGGDDKVEIVEGLPLYIKGDQTDAIAQSSDFRLLTDKQTGSAPVPLVLPVTKFAEKELFYTNGPWLTSNVAPFYCDEPRLDNRELPFDGNKYPYLTPDDIFEPYLIRTPYPINENFFFNGWSSRKDYAYLLPLKPVVFDYFDLCDLMGQTKENHSHAVFKIEPLVSGSAKVVFRIPIQNSNYVTYERIYYNSEDLLPDRGKNIGVIREADFDLYVFPFFHVKGASVSAESPWRVELIDGDMARKQRPYALTFYRGSDNMTIDFRSAVRADKAKGDPLTTHYFMGDREYDYIRVTTPAGASGIVFPIWKELTTGSKKVDFAVDFGTTNTHIEYKVDGQTHPFEITNADVQAMSLHDYLYPDIENLIGEHDLDYFLEIPNQEFVPQLMGADRRIHFPTRTAMCRSRNRESGSEESAALANVAIGFHYERFTEANHNETVTHLKWTGSSEAPLMRAFFDELLMLIRNKVILLGGDLAQTSITWFYPVSMLPYQRSQLTSIWNTRAAAIISPACHPVSITESIAPYYYYKNVCGVSSAVRPVVSMDVGGETTDFVVYSKGRPELLSSVRFAGNSIFGDFYGTDINRNGFVARYEPKVLDAISPFHRIRSSYDKIRSRGISADVVSFMFSLQDNPQLAGRNVSLSQWISEDYDMKFVLLAAYTAQIYYVSQMLRLHGVATPAYLTLSGTASQLLSLIAENDILELFTCHVFNELLGDNGKVELRRVDHPKVITCKGGLNLHDEDRAVDVALLREVFSGSTSFDSTDRTFSDAGPDVQHEVLASYRQFIDFFLGIDRVLPFQHYFGISSSRMERYRSLLLDKADQYMAAMLEERRREASALEQNPHVWDALFFYPLCGSLNALAYYISKN